MGPFTQEERVDIERIQKCAANIILGEEYSSYRKALQSLNLCNQGGINCALILRKRLKSTLNFKSGSNLHTTGMKQDRRGSSTVKSRLSTIDLK